MSTLTCSNFLPKVQLSPYHNDRYLLTAHGQFLELFDLDKYLSDDFDARDFEPIRTRVFESNNVQCFAVFEDTGHVLSVTSDFSRSKLSISACLVHHELLLEGGYADTSSTHYLLEESSREGKYVMAAIPGTNEILLLTESTLTHFKYSFYPADNIDVHVEVVSEFELRSLLPPFYTKHIIRPLAVDSSSNYSIIISVGSSIVLLKQQGQKWACRAMQDLQETNRVMIIPGVDMAVLSGKYSSQFISTSSIQKGVSKDQLRVLSQRMDTVTTNALATISSDGITYVYAIGEQELALWKVHNQRQQISGAWVFTHSSENVELRKMGDTKRTREHRVYKRTGDGENRAMTCERIIEDIPGPPQTFHCNPLAATIIRRNNTEVLIISYESGCVKVLNTEDVIRNEMCSFVPIGKKKMAMENLFPIWEFPLDPIAPLTRLTGLSNGIPIVFKLENGMWNSTEIVHPRKVAYSSMQSKTSACGSTVTVFYNQHDICFCLFDKGIEWREDRVSNEIKNCFISLTIVAIVTDEKILFVDIRGLLNKIVGVPCYSASIDYNALGFDDDSKEDVIARGLGAMELTYRKEDDMCLMECRIQLNNGVTCSFPLDKWPISRETSLNVVYDRKYTGEVVKIDLSKRRIIEIENNHGKVLSLEENGLFLRNGLGETEDRTHVTDLYNYLPKSAQIIELLAIQGTDVNDAEVYVLAKEKQRGDYLYLKDADTKFGDKPVFGHFVGPKKNGRCVLYTTSTRRYGDVPELIRLKARVSHVHIKESLQLGGSLFQPNKTVQLVHRKTNLISSNTTINVISSCGHMIEIHELSGKGRLVFKKEIELRNEDDKPIFISSFDTYYVHFSHTMHIIAGSSTGELISITWDSATNEHICELANAESAISEVFFFEKEHNTDMPKLFACVDETYYMVFQMDSDTKVPKRVERFPFRFMMGEVPFVNKNSKVISVCTGVGSEIHDIWMISPTKANLYSGRNSKFLSDIQHYNFSSWSGNPESICLLSTRKHEANEIYANIVFVVKEKCRIGIIATVQTLDKFPDKIVFTKFGKISKSKSIAIDSELLDCSVQPQNQIDVNIRLFVARRKSVKIFLLKLSINSRCLKVVETVQLGEIPTTISDPSHFVVTKMEELTDRVTPKYGIISGNEGTQTIRICANKLLHPIKD